MRLRLFVIALLISPAAARADICVSCAAPAATYDCTVKKADKIEGLAGAKTVNKICIKVLKRTGQHASCEVVEASTCPGTPRTIGWKEVKEALAGADDPDPPAKAAAKAPATPKASPNPAPAPATASKQAEPAAKDVSGPPSPQPAPEQEEEPTIAGNIKGAAEKTWNCVTSLFGKC